MAMLPGNGIDNILIRGTNWIGDAVISLPAVSAVRKAYPSSRMTMLAKPWVADLYRLCPEIDEVMLYDDPGRHTGVRGLLRLARELRDKRFHMAILLQNAIEAAIISRLAGIPVRAGYNTDARGFLLTHAVRITRRAKALHQTDYYLNMVRELGCVKRGNPPYLTLRPQDVGNAASLLAGCDLGSSTRIVGIAPGATYGPAKQWIPERFAAVADLLREEPSTACILFGSEADRPTSEAILSAARYPHADFTGKTSLLNAVSLIACCRLFISNDSGLMHLAAALSVPTIAIFGSTNPHTTGPTGDRSVVIYKGVDCSPCLKKRCTTDFRCMHSISTKEVFEEAKRVLG